MPDMGPFSRVFVADWNNPPLEATRVSYYLGPDPLPLANIALVGGHFNSVAPNGDIFNLYSQCVTRPM